MFKAIIVNKAEDDTIYANLSDVKDSQLPEEGDVTIAVHYSDVNFKDGLCLNGKGRLVREYPHIPGIDFSGTVAQGDGEEFKEGDRVILTGCRAGELFDGGYSQYAKVKKDHITKTPEGMTNKQAMILGTAGLTGLLCAFAVKAREELLMQSKVNDVLVTGSTGGVGMVAVMVLAKMGINVTAIITTVYAFFIFIINYNNSFSTINTLGHDTKYVKITKISCA